MGVIFQVLKEELERLNETEISYVKAIADMPRGIPRISKRGKNAYLYLEYRDGKNIINKYIALQNSLKAKSIMEKVAQRIRYEKLLKETKSALKEVRKALRGKI